MKGIQLMIGLLFLTMGCASSQNSPLKYADEVDGKGKTVFEGQCHLCQNGVNKNGNNQRNQQGFGVNQKSRQHACGNYRQANGTCF